MKPVLAALVMASPEKSSDPLDFVPPLPWRGGVTVKSAPTLSESPIPESSVLPCPSSRPVSGCGSGVAEPSETCPDDVLQLGATEDRRTTFTCVACHRLFSSQRRLAQHTATCRVTGDSPRKRARAVDVQGSRTGLRRAASINVNQGGVLCLRNAAPAALLQFMDRLMDAALLEGPSMHGARSTTLCGWLEHEKRSARIRIPLGGDAQLVSLLKEWLESALRGSVEPILRSLPHVPELPQQVDIAAFDADDINLIVGRTCPHARSSSHGSLPLHRDVDVADLSRGACIIAVIVLLDDVDTDTGYTRVYANSRKVQARSSTSTTDSAWDPQTQTQRAKQILSGGNYVTVDCKGRKGDVFMFDASNLHEVIGASVRANACRRVLLFDLWTCTMIEQSTRWTTDRALVLRPILCSHEHDSPAGALASAPTDSPGAPVDDSPAATDARAPAAADPPPPASDSDNSHGALVTDSPAIAPTGSQRDDDASVSKAVTAYARHQHQQYSLAYAQQANVALISEMFPAMTLKERGKWLEVKTTLVCSVRFDQNDCLVLETFLSQHWPEGATGLQHSELPIPISGFGSYGRTLHVHDCNLQKEQTLCAERAKAHQWHCPLQWLRTHAPGFRELESDASKWLCRNVGVHCDTAACQLLRQSRASCSSTTFDLHQDTEAFPSTRYSVIVKLSAQQPWEPASQMQVAGTAQRFAYGASRGAAAIFLGALFHRGVPHMSSKPCLKIAFHFAPISDAERRMRRGERST